MAIHARWALPATIPSTDRCFLVRVPDDQLIIGAFKGALYELAKPYAWGNDEAHTAQLVAARCLGMFNSIQPIDCEAGMMQLRACSEFCGIEYSTDGINWTCIDLSGCIADIVITGINDSILNGVIQGGQGQQAPQPPPAPMQCTTFHVHLNAFDRWICPFPVNDGWSVAISNARGGWRDSDQIAGIWFCPNGAGYLLGACVDNRKVYEETDPLPTAYHMQLIGQLGEGAFFDPLTATYEVPVGTHLQNLFIQANDTPLNDNLGSVDFDVTLCTTAVQHWEHTFVLSELGAWRNDNGWASWDGVKWNEVEHNGEYILYIELDLPVLPSGDSYEEFRIPEDKCSGFNMPDNIRIFDGEHNLLFENLDWARVLFSPGYGGGGEIMLSPNKSDEHPYYIQEVIVRGIGSDPF